MLFLSDLVYLVVLFVLRLTLLLERLEIRYHVNRSETNTKHDVGTEDAVASSWKERRKKKRRKRGFGGADTEPSYHMYTAGMLTEPWMDAFLASPEGAEEHEFYCMICKQDISLRGEGASELLHEFSSDSHFPRDQRFRFTDDGVVYDALGRHIENMDNDLHTEIMSRTPVTRGPRHPFFWDCAESDESVVSRAPSRTLLGATVELLRHGGR